MLPSAFEDKELPADKIDEDVGNNESNHGDQWMPIQEIDQRSLPKRSSHCPRHIHKREIEKLHDGRMSPWGKNPAGVEPIDKGIDDDERNRSGLKACQCPIPWAAAQVGKLRIEKADQESEDQNVEAQGQDATDRILDELNDRMRLAGVDAGDDRFEIVLFEELKE